MFVTQNENFNCKLCPPPPTPFLLDKICIEIKNNLVPNAPGMEWEIILICNACNMKTLVFLYHYFESINYNFKGNVKGTVA